MRNVTLVVITFLLACLSAFAQTPDATPLPTVGTIAYQPQYFLAAGGGWSKYTDPHAHGWMTMGAKVSENNFVAGNLVMTSTKASTTVDFGRYLIQENGFTLAALGGLGMASGSGAVNGEVAGGVSLAKDLSKWTKVPHTAVVFTVKADKVAGDDIKPAFLLGFVIGFGH